MPKPISQAEFTVMEVLWAENPLAASEVFDKLQMSTDWNIRTVKTLLSRLKKKKPSQRTRTDDVFFTRRLYPDKPT